MCYNFDWNKYGSAYTNLSLMSQSSVLSPDETGAAPDAHLGARERRRKLEPEMPRKNIKR
jgi:hypothetical protein